MDSWIVIAVGLGIFGIITAGTVKIVRHRAEMRAAAHKADAISVISNDTLRAAWYSGADHHSGSDSSEGGGGGSSD